jgi:Putative Ig domain
LKHTNLSPYIKSLIKDQNAVAGQPFNFTIPDNIFFDDDNKVPLTYSATLINGNPLPSWISFDPGTRTFSGKPVEKGDLTIRVVVADKEKATAFCPVKIIITANSIK